MEEKKLPHRYATVDDFARSHPIHVVWEITLACNLKCMHCGSRAGKARPSELTTEECIDVVRQLARLRVREVTVIGGEAFLRRDWLTIIQAISDHGMHPSMQSGGLALNEDRIRAAKAAGLRSCGVSLDGLPELHDKLRGVKGSFEHAMRALRLLKKYDIPSSVNTQIGATTLPDLRELLHQIADAGARNWQIQLTVAMGNAADHDEILMQPYQILELMPHLAELFDEALSLGVLMQPGNNIGYFGPYEHRWRVTDAETGHFQGCSAGHTGLGIEADGTIKGCPSLATADYSGGNVRDMTIDDIWNHSDQLRFTRDRTIDDLWGFCRSCYYADVCRAGCTWTNHTLLGRAGNNPYCHHRALTLAKEGKRERIVKVEEAPGKPFDAGRFALLLEPIDGSGEAIVQEPPPPRAKSEIVRSTTDRVPQSMTLCRGCEQYVYPGTEICPFCGGDIVTLADDYARRQREIAEAAARLRAMLSARSSAAALSFPADSPLKLNADI
jgi:Y-X(10)_GDL-associated radical SAM protein